MTASADVTSIAPKIGALYYGADFFGGDGQGGIRVGGCFSHGTTKFEFVLFQRIIGHTSNVFMNSKRGWKRKTDHCLTENEIIN